MSSQEPNGIAVDPQKVSQRAYARVAALTLQVDQWETAYETQGLELAKVQAELGAMRTTQPGGRSAQPVIEVQDPTPVTRD